VVAGAPDGTEGAWVQAVAGRLEHVPLLDVASAAPSAVGVASPVTPVRPPHTTRLPLAHASANPKLSTFPILLTYQLLRPSRGDDS
jgi:hypothetical protein